jgi:hypothetical protein
MPLRLKRRRPTTSATGQPTNGNRSILRGSGLIVALAASVVAVVAPAMAAAATPEPAIPTGLTATAGDGKVTLDWTDSKDLVAGDRYQVYQDRAMIADGPTPSTYTASGLTNGRAYSFRVSAGGSTSRPAGDLRYGAWTDAVTATPTAAGTPAPPTPTPTPNPLTPNFPSSYFNKRVPASATGSSSSLVSRMIADGKPSTLDLNGWQYPQYDASAGNPEYTVTATNYVGPQGDHKVRIPAGALPAPGADANMAITDRSANEYWGFYGVTSIDRNAHTIRARGAGTVPLSSNGAFRGESSLNMATKGGIVTPEELQAGHIDHALMVVISCSTGAVNGAGNTRQCSSMGKPAGLPNGAHLQLQISDAELNAFPAWKRAILRSMRDYGIYVAETGGGFLKADYAPGTALATKWQNWLNAHDSEAGVNAAGRSLDFVTGVQWGSRLRVVTP